MVSNFQIPVNTKTKQPLTYPEGDYEMIDNYEFEDVLAFGGFVRGRSAARIVWKSTTNNRKYEMFLSNLCECFDRIINGTLTGKFTFCKRGCNYGIKYLGDLKWHGK